MSRRGLTDKELLEELQKILEDKSDGEELSDSSEDYVPSCQDRSSDDSHSSYEEMEGPQSEPSTSFQGKATKRKKQVHQAENQTVIPNRIGETNATNKSFVSKNGKIWNILQSGDNTAGRLQQQNILREKSGPTPYAKRNIDDKVISAWQILIDHQMLRHIQRCTEAEAHRQLENNNWSMTNGEIEAFIAIIYARGAYGANTLSVESLWSQTWGSAFFSQVMSRNRFKEIMRYLRFDLKTQRSERLKTDKFALASQIWKPFVEKCILCYKPGENVTVDEQLFPTKARCRFTQYMSNKPDKFGIKFWMAADVESKYFLNGFPYLGKDETRPVGESLSETVVLRLLEPFLNKGRNVTTDNFFTSLSLAEKLRTKGTSIVGTMNRIRREIPPFAKNNKSPLYTTTILKHDTYTLTVYQGKVNKNVLLLSSMHPTVDIGTDAKKLPETVAFYNNTKYGVDVVDQMARKYSTKAGCRRWPTQVFYNVLDLAAINACILYNSVTGKKLKRRDFILQLAKELSDEYITKTNATTTANVAGNRKRRQCMTTKCGNKTMNACKQCQKAVCGKCTAKTEITCIKCADNL